MSRILTLSLIVTIQAKQFCPKSKMPLELGVWRHDLQHMDSAVVENQAVTISEGQVYVYENYFPGYVINYISVDNLAIKSCGASATLKTGGVGTSSVLIVLKAEPNHEIRSVVDIWGTKSYFKSVPSKKTVVDENMKNLKSLYVMSRTVNHNKAV